MVARTSSEAARFSPVDRPRVAIASDGTLAAIGEATRVSVLEIPGGAPFAEIGIDTDASANEIAWIGAPPRLLVLTRYQAHSTVHLIDPYGPRTVAEIRLESPMRLFATVGAHALAVGPLGAAVLTAGEAHLTPYQFPSRSIPVAAGAAAGQFLVALPGSVEEWDPQSRMPKRRLRLPRPAVITAVGGSERVVWMTTQQDPTRIDVIPLVNRGQPKSHELPEPIGQASGHPRSDLVVCVGANSGRLYVVDLDGRSQLRVIGPEGIERTEGVGLVVGRMVGVLAAQARRPVVIVSLDGREIEARGPVAAPGVAGSFADPGRMPSRSTLGADEVEDSTSNPNITAVKLASAVLARELAVPAPSPAFHHAPAAVASAAIATRDLSEQLRAWRERLRQPQPRGEPVASIDPGPSWRDELAAWARAVAAGSADASAPSVPSIDALVARFDLAPQLAPALGLLYGVHLEGRAAAPVEIAHVLGGRWDEALGRGQLAARGIARYESSRVRYAPAILRVLDELPLALGTIVGEPGTIALLGPCVVVASDASLATIAERYLPSVGGAILAAADGIDPRELYLEARARGAVPMLRVTAELDDTPAEPAILVVTDEAIAEQLGVPRLS